MSPTRHYPSPAVRVELAGETTTEWHDHDRHQLLYPHSGVLAVATTSGAWVVPPARAIWLPAGQPHGHRAHGATHVCSLLFARPITRFHTPTLVEVRPLVREIILALTDHHTVEANDDEQRSHLEALIYSQLRPAAEVSSYLPEPHDDRLQAIASALRSNPADDRDLRSFGRHVGASTRTLSRLFSDEVGLSFPQWRARLRIHLACLELAHGRSIATVAYSHGYTTVSAFSQAFRRHTGVTPAAYRTQTSTPQRPPAMRQTSSTS